METIQERNYKNRKLTEKNCLLVCVKLLKSGIVEIYSNSGWCIACPFFWGGGVFQCLFASFLWVECLLISGIKLLLRTLVRKYAKGKGPVADSVCGSTTEGRSLLLPPFTSRQERERERDWTYLLWL